MQLKGKIMKKSIDAELDDLMKQLAKHNDQEELAAALGRKFGKLLQTRWPSSTSIWARAFSAAIVSVEDDTGDKRGCRSLLIQWMMEHFAGFVIEQFLPDINDVLSMLKYLQYTKTDPLVFNDIDNQAWFETPTVFIMESQSRRKLVVIDGFKVHVRKVWYKHDESRNAHTWHKPKTLAWYRKNNWKIEYGDCRDYGYILSYDATFSKKTVDRADSYWHELEMFVFDIHLTLDALHDVQTNRMSKLHQEKSKP